MTDLDISISPDINEDKQRCTKRKIAVIFGYLGTDFSGLQLNEGVRTVEQVLEKAFHECGCIADYNHDAGLQKVQWTRSSRTDKGVHAAINVISFKCMKSDHPDLLQDLRSHLPDDVKLYACLRVTKSFHSKLMTTSREYEYVLPAFMFNSLSDHERASLRDVADIDQCISQIENPASNTIDIMRFNSVLSLFLGTNSYHNFTTGTSSFDSSAKRYITKFQADIVNRPDGNLVRIQVHGQAFLYNQIRKMIGTCIAVYHQVLDEYHLKLGYLFDSMKLYKLPLAPASGLFLQRPLFRDYNLKLSERQDLKPLDFAEFESDVNDFVSSKIYTEIVSHDKIHHEFARWLLSTIFDESTDWNSCKQAERPSIDADQPNKKKRRKYRNQWN